MKHFTYKQLKNTAFNSAKSTANFIMPSTCGTGEYIVIGCNSPCIAVFIKSEKLDDATDFNGLFKLGHNSDKCMSIIQYVTPLGGYLYTWAKY
jgi:hypothetical protein